MSDVLLVAFVLVLLFAGFLIFLDPLYIRDIRYAIHRAFFPRKRESSQIPVATRCAQLERNRLAGSTYVAERSPEPSRNGYTHSAFTPSALNEGVQKCANLASASPSTTPYQLEPPTPGKRRESPPEPPKIETPLEDPQIAAQNYHKLHGRPNRQILQPAIVSEEAKKKKAYKPQDITVGGEAPKPAAGGMPVPAFKIPLPPKPSGDSSTKAPLSFPLFKK